MGHCTAATQRKRTFYEAVFKSSEVTFYLVTLQLSSDSCICAYSITPVNESSLLSLVSVQLAADRDRLSSNPSDGLLKCI